MQTFVVTIKQEFQADTAEEAALLMYQYLATSPVPVSYAVTDDETNVTVEIRLDQTQADEFAATDHTADPGNW